MLRKWREWKTGGNGEGSGVCAEDMVKVAESRWGNKEKENGGVDPGEKMMGEWTQGKRGG